MFDQTHLRPMFFVKYHALGNDYIVLDAATCNMAITPSVIIHLCDRHEGIGADGVLLRVLSHDDTHALRIFNPDGTEAEKSGNGLRIFAQYLIDLKIVQTPIFTLKTVQSTHQASKRNGLISIDMGCANMISCDTSALRLVDAALQASSVVISCVNIGNPHCVVLMPALLQNDLYRLGPLLENHPLFPHRTNVQLIHIRNRQCIDMLVWERGAGATRASGSSSCAAVAAAYYHGWVDNNVRIYMPGGMLSIVVDTQTGCIDMSGPVCCVYWGYLNALEVFS